MNKVRSLLRKAKTLAIEFIGDIYPDNEDGFITALGVEEGKYEVQLPSGTVGYDFIKAMNDRASEVWND